jgi:branched-chain amino acid transport system substrate-binding protein
MMNPWRGFALAALLAVSGAAHAQEIVVGVPHALTGPYAFVGVPIKNGIMLALEEANEKRVLGEARLKPIVLDDNSDKAQAIALTNQLHARDKALIMLGPTSSIEGTAAAPVANDLKFPMFTSAVSADVLKAGPWSYKVTSSPADIMKELGNHAVQKLKVKRAIFVFNRDNDGFVAQKNTIRDVMKAGGVTVAGEEGILGSDTDFVALSTKLAASDADAVFIASPAEQGANIILQAKQAGLSEKTVILAPPSMASQAFIKTGGKAVDGVVLVADYFAGSKTPQNEAFSAAYQKKYGAAPDNWAAVGYALGTIAVEAIKAAGPNPTRESVIQAFGKLGKMPTVLGSGTFEFGPDRAPHYGAAILSVTGGQFMAVPAT